MEKKFQLVGLDLMELEMLTPAEYPLRFTRDCLEDSDMSWRWHPDPEFNVVLRGTIDFYVGDTCHRLTAGEGIFKNANVLHRTAPAPGCREPEMFTVILGTEFLGPAQSLLFQKYMAPVLSSRGIQAVPLSPDVPWQGAVLKGLHRAWEENDRGEGAYELRIHESLFGVWRVFAEHREEVSAQEGSDQSFRDQIRVKQMMACIHERYREKLTLREIAAAAHVSENTCRTCFRAVVRRSPTEYLMEFRLQESVRLLRTTDLTAEEIAHRCGFGDGSYFNRLFRRKMGVSPIRYRKEK